MHAQATPGTFPRTPPDERGAYRADIDGLRALAVIAVVLFHAHVSQVSGGFVGVDVFFVISGYLIGAHIYRDLAAGRFRISTFYARRAKRILPALFTVLLFSLVLGLCVLSAPELLFFSSSALSTLLSISNFFALGKTGYFTGPAENNLLLMTWSLSVEEQFYIFFPLLMIVTAKVLAAFQRRSVLRRALLMTITTLSLLSFALSVAGVYHFPNATFYLLPARAWELGLGVSMAIYEAAPDRAASRDTAAAPATSAVNQLYGGNRWANARSLAGLAAILFGILHFAPATPFPGVAALAPVGGAGLLLSARQAWFNRRVLSLPPLRWIGWVSYSWYLWHWPILSFARISSDRPIPVRVALALILLALLLAAITYKFIEQPFRKSTLAVRPLLLRYAAVMAIAGAACFLVHISHGLPQRFPQEEHEEASYQHFAHTCIAVSYVDRLDNTPTCDPPPDGRPAAALLGDSHAGALSSQLRSLAEAQGFRLLMFTHVQCQPLIDVIDPRGDAAEDRSCAAFNRKALQRIVRDPTISTVLLAADWGGPDEWAPDGPGYTPVGGPRGPHAQSLANLDTGLSRYVVALQKSGKQVILFQDIQPLRFDPMRRLRARLIPVRGWINRRVQPGGFVTAGTVAHEGELFNPERAAAAAVVSRIAQRDHVRIFDLRPGLCTGDQCLYSANQVNLYSDSNHLSPSGTSIVLKGFTFADSQDSLPK